jgi:hypothetical protein
MGLATAVNKIHVAIGLTGTLVYHMAGDHVQMFKNFTH